MQKLNIRRGATAGAGISFVLAASLSARSSEPVVAFLETLAFGLVGTALVIGVGTAINRRRESNVAN